MPTLDEIRAQLRDGRDVSEAAREKSRLDTDKVRKRHSSRKYTVSINGTDATLNFGKWNGHAVSDLAKTREGRGYLDFILKEFKDEDLKEIIRHQRNNAGHPAR